MAMQVIGHLATISIVFLLFSSKGTAASMAKPDCPEKCGNVDIFYPFGIGRGCYHDRNFEVSCNHSYNPPHPFLVALQVEVLQTSLEDVRIYDLYDAACKVDSISQVKYLPMEPYSYSHEKNKFIGIGCDIGVYIGESNRTSRSLTKYAGGCVSVCHIPGGEAWSNLTSCSGIGCCQTTFSNDLSNVGLWIVRMRLGPPAKARSTSNSCFFALIAEKNFLDFDRFNTTMSDEIKTYYYPAVMNWAIGNKSCKEARKSRDYACGSNSDCVTSVKGSGYNCRCRPGYLGNPYLQDGCRGTMFFYSFLYSWLGSWICRVIE